MQNLLDDIDDDLLDSTPSLPGETVPEYAARIARLSKQTPQQDREAALVALRDVLNNPRSKPADRKSAADSLLKAAADSGKVTAATEQAMAMSDEELLGEIHAARTRREAGVASGNYPSTMGAFDEVIVAPVGLAGLDGIADIDPLML